MTHPLVNRSSQALYKQWLPLIVIVGIGLLVLVLRFLL